MQGVLNRCLSNKSSVEYKRCWMQKCWNWVVLRKNLLNSKVLKQSSVEPAKQWPWGSSGHSIALWYTLQLSFILDYMVFISTVRLQSSWGYVAVKLDTSLWVSSAVGLHTYLWNYVADRLQTSICGFFNIYLQTFWANVAVKPHNYCLLIACATLAPTL